MTDPNIQFEEDAPLLTHRFQPKIKEQQSTMITFVMKKFNVDDKKAQHILLATSGFFFLASIALLITHFIL